MVSSINLSEHVSTSQYCFQWFIIIIKVFILSKSQQLDSLNVNKRTVKELSNDTYVTKFDESSKTIIDYTPIQSFYRNQTIFITGT